MVGLARTTILILCLATLAGASPGPLGAMEPRLLPDEDLAQAVRSFLLSEPSVDANLVDVRVVDNLAFLRGSVSSLSARRRAVALAGMVKGVRAVNDRITVVPQPRRDRDVAREVRAALEADPALKDRNLDVDVHHGTVTLQGKVDTWARSFLADDVAGGVRGVVAVENRIAPSEIEPRANAELEAAVARRLAANDRVRSDRITVKVHRGLVRLAGAAGSAYERSLAERLAFVPGVSTVDASQLMVHWWEFDGAPASPGEAREFGNGDVERAAKEALFLDPRTTSENVTVRVDRGEATLSGSVSNLVALHAATRLVEALGGVRWVRNLVQLRPAEVPAGGVLARRVHDALRRSCCVDAAAIKVEANNGTVRLIGRLSGEHEVALAEQLAAGVEGVVAVTNTLTAPKQREPRPDVRIARDLDSRLRWTGFVRIDGVEPAVENGVVTLKGKVGCALAVRVAEEAARAVGALEVKNELKVDLGRQAD